MKVYQFMIMTVIAVGIIVAFTIAGSNNRGFIYDIANYNPDVNTTLFSDYDLRSDMDADIEDFKNRTEFEGVSDQDTEQDIYKRLWAGTKDMSSSFVHGYKLANNVSTEFGLDKIFLWVLTGILAIWLFAKLIGRFFLDR